MEDNTGTALGAAGPEPPASEPGPLSRWRWNLIPGFGRYRDWYRLEELRERANLLREEIGHLEKAKAAGQEEELSSFDRFVQGYRRSIYDEQLAEKRAELEALLPELRALEAKNPKAPPIRPPRPQKPAPGPRRLSRRRIAMALVPVVVAAGLAGVVMARARTGPEANPPPSYELAPVTRRPVREQGEMFFSRELEFTYKGGTVIISGEPPVTGQFWVDDKIVLTVTRPDGTVVTWEKMFNEGCYDNRAAPAQEITELFQPGPNRILVQLFDVCGTDVGTLNKVLLTEI